MDTHNVTEIPILKKLYDLYKLWYAYLTLFPKKDKYTLGARCEQHILTTLELILGASSAVRSDKRPYLQQASVQFDMLKIFFRLARELKLIDVKKYILLETLTQDIGRMLGGWQRSIGQ